MVDLKYLYENRPGLKDIINMALQVIQGPPKELISPEASPGFMPTTTPTPTPTATPTPTPTPTPQPQTSKRMRKSEMMGLIKKYFPEEEWNNAYKVVLGESGGDPTKVGDEYFIGGEMRPSHGLFQIREFEGRPLPEDLYNPETNVEFAAKLFKDQGWEPWSVAKDIGLVEGYKIKPEVVKRIQDAEKIIDALGMIMGQQYG